MNFKKMTKTQMEWVVKLTSEHLIGVSNQIVSEHSRYVADLAIDVAVNLGLQADEILFVEEAALLHDIGVCQVNAPELGLFGKLPYIQHGVAGRSILEQAGYPAHALICERHTGVGITSEDILKNKLRLPVRDMCPVSLPEQIICFADLFYSKTPGRLGERKNVDKIRNKLAVFGKEKVIIFDEWLKVFGAAVVE